MASSSDVVKKIMRLKRQLSDKADPATVLKILQKLKDLDITLDVLAETGIGKTVNSLRRHEQAGELAKSLVKGWKKLLSKESTSRGEDGTFSESLSVKDKLDDQSSPNNGNLEMEDVNNNLLTSHHSKNSDSSDDGNFKTGKRKMDSQKGQCEGRKRKTDCEKSPENQYVSRHDVLTQKDKMDKKKKKDRSDRKPGDCDRLLGNKNLKESQQRSRSDSREKCKSASESGRFGSDREKNTKSKLSKESRGGKEDDRMSGMLRSSDAQKRKTKHITSLESEREHSKHKKAKTNETKSDPEEPSMSFESYLNYDMTVYKRKERSGMRKPPKKPKMIPSEQQIKDPVIKNMELAPKQKFLEPVMHLMNIPLPAALPECDKPSSFDYYERKVEKEPVEPDFCDVSEESAVFTGQRLNRKMQVYSGAKTVFLPAMLSLYQQCIRTLQNNINLLYETGGVPFEILEPVLEKCTPEQLLRIEECNPIYVGVTDHLWGKHCQRDFKDSKLQEYESWKEMYIRLSEERERKLKRLTKTIVSAQSQKPKGRQVKMAFIHTVAKPPRDVRIQQEIHGTAVQQPHQPRSSVKIQDNRSKQSYEPSRPSSTSSGGSGTQDARKKTRVAPMMAKSLKAFKKQLGRR
ncbi:elongin A, like isoform X1 [Astatotilapia calliptera]|uniref:elongin A, like isoform X1 n=1 Tax=Astatotilapia calliptera TaxID=8154 RepID=UPI000E3FCACE|nr:elongin-A-like isoform X1 [Astatotilapia calliptera]